MRTEYDAWQMEVELDYYEHMDEKHYLDNAEALAKRIMTMQSPDGGFYKDSTTFKIYNGEVGLVAWGFFRLYKITSNKKYLVAGDKAMKYLKKNPTLPKKDEPHLYDVFLAWNNYAYLVRSSISDKKTYLNLAINNTKILLDHQWLTGNWSIVLHYDLYIAQNLMFMYQYTKSKKYLNAVLKFVGFAKYHNFFGMYPIHYFPIGFMEMASGYSTNQFARLLFYLHSITGKTNYYYYACKLVNKIEKNLTEDGEVYKSIIKKDKNKLATMWLNHNRLLKDKALGICLSQL